MLNKTPNFGADAYFIWFIITATSDDKNQFIF